MSKAELVVVEEEEAEEEMSVGVEGCLQKQQAHLEIGGWYVRVHLCGKQVVTL